MSRSAITVECLSKAYHIGLKRDRADTLVGALHKMARAPLTHLRHMRRMNTFRHLDDADDVYWALRDVSFAVPEGEVIGIIGRNGAGKSTLLKILSRITEPTKGRATIRGRVSSLLEVGTGFHLELSGRENIYMNGTILGMTKREIDRKFDEIVDFSGVEKFLDTPIKHYSTGMRVRLAFAVAAHLEPEILVIDEVLAVGDAEFQKKCIGKMHDAATSGRTVIFVSHNMSAVSNLCKHVVVLDQGAVAFDGLSEDGIRVYSSTVPSQLPNVELLNTEYRRKGATPIFSKLALRNHLGESTTQLTCGKGFELIFELNSAEVPSHCELSAAVLDSFGNRLFTVGTYLSINRLPTLTSPGLIACQVDPVPIPPGTYSLHLFAGPMQHLDRDAIEPAIVFDLVAQDFYGNGIALKPERGSILMRSEWTHSASTTPNVFWSQLEFGKLE